MRRRLLMFALLLVLPLRLAAQSTAVTGKVTDASLAPVAGAHLVAAGADGVASQSTDTDTKGEYSLSLTAGTYTVTVSADGFTAATVRVIVPLTSPVGPVVLQVAGFRDAVTVSGESGYVVPVISTATKTPTPLRDVPQSVSVVTKELIQDQVMMSMADVVKYVPGIESHQGENNRDQVVIRGNSSSADFYVNGVRDDVQYYRDLYNLDRIEALKGPNAMVFGRGGGGGLINQVTKQAGFQSSNEVTAQLGSFDNRRFTADVDRPLSGTVAVRLNGVYENSDSFRDFVNLERYGVNPTVTFAPSDRTRVIVSYEYLHDRRVADRGITSFQGAPADVPISTYYGDPNQTFVRANVNLASTTVEHHAGRLTFRNQTLFGDYDRGYQNFVPGVVTPDGSQVTLSAYNNATARQNLFNQTDLTYTATTGAVRHTLLAGAEFGLQSTDNFRNTGYFNNLTTTILAPFDDPTISTPVTWRQSATDADNHLRTNVAAGYVQDQAELSSHVQLLGGVRFDRFDLTYHNNRTGDTLGRTDNLVSPRAGLVYKPTVPVSIYTSYSVSYLPSSGDQFSSLTNITEQLEPEKFTNYEAGTKWDASSALSLTAAVYRLDRTNTRSIDPNDATRIIQTGSQRTNGVELAANGRISKEWNIAGGYAYQDAFVTSATASAIQGAQVALVPHNTFSLWNRYQFVPRVGAGLGVIYRSDVFAAIDNKVTLPGYVRLDAAAYVNVSKDWRLQANVENLTDEKYYVNADSNTNISPGFSRAVRVALIARF
jgi:catecholate siderophore receptor